MNADFLPGFQFGANVDISDEQLKEETNRETRVPTYKKVELVILKVTFAKPNDNDPTWVNANIIFGLPGWKDSGETKLNAKGNTVTIYHDEKGKVVNALQQFLMIPTSKAYFDGSSGTPTLMPFQNVQRFFAGLGVELKPSSMSQVIPYYFSESGKKLLGLTVSALCGYEKTHVEFDRETELYVIKNKAGVTIQLPEGKKNEFASREEAIEAGLDAGMDELVESAFSKVLKFYKAKTVKAFNIGEAAAADAVAETTSAFDD